MNTDAAITQRSVFVHAGALAELIPQLGSVVERIGAHVRGGAASANTPLEAAAPAPDVMAELQALKARVEALEAQRAASAGAAASTPPSGSVSASE